MDQNTRFDDDESGARLSRQHEHGLTATDETSLEKADRNMPTTSMLYSSNHHRSDSERRFCDPSPIRSLVERFRPNLASYEDLYRDLHQDPELSNSESTTAALVAQHLRHLAPQAAYRGSGPNSHIHTEEQAFEMEVLEHIGGHGVVAILRSPQPRTKRCQDARKGSSPEPVVMLRADMDALPIEEKTGLPYASTKKVKDGGGTTPVMHACGHDMHVVSLLAVAKLLAEAAQNTDAAQPMLGRNSCTNPSWTGTAILVFQPAEEPLTGARAMVDDGLFSSPSAQSYLRPNFRSLPLPTPTIVLGQHVTNLRAGSIALSPGAIMAASDTYQVRILGRGGHAAKPQLALDPVLLSAYILVRLQSIVSREVAPTDVAVLTCGSIHGGSTTAANVIPDFVDIKLNLRTYDTVVRSKVIDAMERVIKGECAASGAPDPIIERTGLSIPALINNADVAERLRSEFGDFFGGEAVWEQEPETASEDFSVLANAAGAPYAYRL